ncbi:MAG: DUF4276 family protein [Sedimentisphaerales bacterium]|nr:DUF4276 family protein [Sedimentisphaerales bacterium]
MSSAEVYIVVEGHTEQTFVRDVLAPTMSCQGVCLYPALIGKPGHKGGDVRFDRAMKDIRLFLEQRPDTYVSTMFDYFRIDPDWPGRVDVSRQVKGGVSLTAEQKAAILEVATLDVIEDACPNTNARQRFIPYIEMHEFEALLFNDARILAEKANIAISAINRILDEHGEPEEINDDPLQAPSKQMMALNNGYRKVAMGKAIAETIGVPTLREKCSHFNAWLVELEGLCHHT